MERFGGCPAHLRPDEFDRFVAGIRPGADLDLRGVTVPAWLLDALLDALTGPDGRPHIGRTRFDGAVLPSHAVLHGACVEGDSSFDGACFLGGASFYDARFFGNVSFRGARFGGNASFHAARFHRHASFEEAVLAGDALFGEAAWHADASFRRTVFIGAACFDRARFGRDAAMQAACFGGAVSFKRVHVARHARFERARFRCGVWLGPLVVGGRIGLADANANGGLRVHAAARQVIARGATVHGAADFRLRHAELDLEDAGIGGTVTVRSLPQPIQGVAEPVWTDPPMARVVSLRGVSSRGLHLADVDLSGCGFLGLHRPDLLRISGDCAFATVPARHWQPFGRPGRPGRAVLAEDLARRTGTGGDRLGAGVDPVRSRTAGGGYEAAGGREAGRGRDSGRGRGTAGGRDAGRGRGRGPREGAGRGRAGRPGAGRGADVARLEVLYRELARASAGCGQAALARDFRYAALELRRHGDQAQWRRLTLHVLWLTSGYGLRTSRMMAWLAVIIALLCCGATYLRHGDNQTSAAHRHTLDRGCSPGRRGLPPAARKAAFTGRAAVIEDDRNVTGCLQ
ncbi:pentapeptide repeat-containing protein [Actinomadura terrae]|uniref:pentapeptide repeat-containing protein n=1 Tax=Actinomadura terrae TaxID=604353 RepID=UPI001FA6BDDC|nr:pentapeptide repeat-containing protein [Actinomadura terrae]